MLRVFYAHKQNDLLNQFMERQIREANIPEDVRFSSWSIDLNEMMAESYELTHHHNLIFKDEKDNLLAIHEGPFSSSELEILIDFAKGLIIK